MTITEKRELYESIMQEVAKTVKRMINESDDAREIVVFTGKSKYFEGDAVERFIEKNTEFKTSHTVNDKTSILITGEKPGENKLKIASEKGITVIPEYQFYKKFNLVDLLLDV